jgi:hypothetical protein
MEQVGRVKKQVFVAYKDLVERNSMGTVIAKLEEYDKLTNRVVHQEFESNIPMFSQATLSKYMGIDDEIFID